MQPSGGNTATQVTQYVYGVTTAGGSAVNSNDLLAATEYPDKTTGQPSSSQEVTYTYNALGQVATMTDRNGNTHTYSYDVLGRVTSDSVTTLGTGVDGTIRRIDTAYDQQGNAYLFTSYADTTGLVVVNQVERLFNGLGQLTAEYQSLTGAVNTTLTPQVQYAYTEMSGGQNNSRLVSMTYPNGRVLSYNYTAGLDSSISRLSSISDNSGTLESYTYLGLGTVVQRSHPQTNVNQTFINQNGQTGDAGDKYTGLDRFGRIVEEAFINAITKAYTDDYLYTYDRDSNVLTKVNNLHTAFNETYTYNGLNELTVYTRANGDSQSYGLDAVGNMTSVNTNGTNQTRTQNAQNELTSVSGATTPVYDKNGNLTTDEAGQTYTYDAWNRLVKVVSGTNIVSYSFDALDRRVTETTNAVTRDLFFDGPNIIEERLAGNSNANIQYVWCPLCVNTLVLRDRDTTGLGTLNERLYVQQDANSNVTALVGTTATVVERYIYTPFGTVMVKDANWNTLGGTQYGMVYLFQGERRDWTTGDDHFDGRDYRATLQTFVSQDPNGFAAGSLSFYAFVSNNPVNYTDPTGAIKSLPKGNPLGFERQERKRLFRMELGKLREAYANERKWEEDLHQFYKKMIELGNLNHFSKEYRKKCREEDFRHALAMAKLALQERLAENRLRKKFGYKGKPLFKAFPNLPQSPPPTLPFQPLPGFGQGYPTLPPEAWQDKLPEDRPLFESSSGLKSYMGPGDTLLFTYGPYGLFFALSPNLEEIPASEKPPAWLEKNWVKWGPFIGIIFTFGPGGTAPAEVTPQTIEHMQGIPGRE